MTGSRIRRTDLETHTPVVSISSEDIVTEDIEFFNEEFLSAIDKEIERAYIEDLRADSKIKINTKFLQLNN